MPLKTNINASIAIVETEAPDCGQARVDLALSLAKELLNGTGNGQADVAFFDTRTLTSGSSEDLDLAGSLVDALGATVNMAEVCAILITADAANTTNLTVGGATAEFQGPFGAAGDTIVVKPGGGFWVFAPAGWAVGAGSTDDLKIANGSGASATYSVAIIGRSA